MDKIKQKHAQLIKALESLNISLSLLKKFQQTHEYYDKDADSEEIYRIHRDSVIQRFEYNIDLLWKYIKTYLESVHLLQGIKVPGEVIRDACAANIISEDEAEAILEMIKSRNMTSHIYIEEIAQRLACLIPSYYSVLKAVVGRLKPR